MGDLIIDTYDLESGERIGAEYRTLKKREWFDYMAGNSILAKRDIFVMSIFNAYFYRWSTDVSGLKGRGKYRDMLRGIIAYNCYYHDYNESLQQFVGDKSFDVVRSNVNILLSKKITIVDIVWIKSSDKDTVKILAWVEPSFRDYLGDVSVPAWLMLLAGVASYFYYEDLNIIIMMCYFSMAFYGHWRELSSRND